MLMENLNNTDNLSHSAALLAAIVDSTDDGIISKTLDGTITSWNQGAEKIYGYQAEEIIGKNVSLLMPPDIADRSTILLSRIKKGERISNFETRRLKKDGSVFTASVTISPILDSQGQIIGASTIVRDITQRKQLEADALKKVGRFRRMFDDHQAIMLLIDPITGQIINANPSAAKFYGYPREQLTSMNIKQINQQPPETTQESMKAVLAGKSNHFIFSHRLASGESRTVEVYSSPITFDDRDVLFSIIHDITDAVAVEEALAFSERRYRSLFESMDEGFALCEMIYDQAGKPVDFRYLFVNPAFARLTHIPVENVTGKTVKEILPGIESFWIESYGQVVQSGVSQRFANPVSPLNQYFDVFAWRTENNKFGVVFTDVTEHRLMQEKIEKLYKKEKLHREKLEEEARVKNLFIDILAHELRNPLTSVLSSSNILQDATGLDESVQQRLAKNITSGANTLARRLDDLLDVARFSRGTFQLQMQPINAKLFLEDVIERFKPNLSQKEQSLQLAVQGELGAVNADQSRLEQVIINLLSNASKYSPEKSLILVSASQKGKHLLVEVKDQGTGIAQDDIDDIFQPYKRIGRTARTPGIGLGLYISKQIIHAHHGKIWVESELGKGSSFRFSIPIDLPVYKG
jgi:PAS domain S-box-containing protein